MTVTDDARQAEPVDVCTDESAATTSSVDEVVAVGVSSQQPGDVDNSAEQNVNAEESEPLKLDEHVTEETELKDPAGGRQEVDISAEREDGAAASEGVVSIAEHKPAVDISLESVSSNADVVGINTQQELANSSHEGDLQSDTAVVDDGEGRSSEIPPHVTDDSTESTHGARKIDWDALERPKQKSSFQENAEFSQVFKKVVKRKSNTENEDSPTVTVESSSSSVANLTVSSLEPCAVTALSSQTSELTDENEGKAEKHETLPLTSSTTEDEHVDTDKLHDVQVETVDQHAVSIEPSEAVVSSNPSNPSNPSCMQLSLSAEDSVVVTQTKSQDDDDDDDTMPSSSRKYSAVAHETKSHDENIKPSYPGKESPTVELKPPTEGTSHGKESSKMVKTDLSSEASNPSSSLSYVTETKSCTEFSGPSSPGEESSSVTKTAPCSEDADDWSSGAQCSSGSSNTEPCTEGTSLPSPGKECSAVTKTKLCYENVSVKQQAEDISTEFESKSVPDPQNDEQSFSVTEVKKTGSFLTNEADFGDSSSNMHSSEPDTQSASGEFHQPATSPPLADPTDQKPVIPAESTGPHDSGTAVETGASDRLLGEDKPSSTDISASASTLEINREGENAAEADPSSVTTSYVAKTVPVQQKKVLPRKSKVQPSETKPEEPAWVTAAKRKSNQWSEGRAEEFDRKPQKPEADADEEVCPYESNETFSSYMC